MNPLSRVSIKAKILVIPAIAVLGFIASLAVNSSINSDNSERLAKIQDLYFPVVQSSRENIVRINRTEELLNTAVSTGESDMVVSAKKTYSELIKKIEEQKALWPEQKKILGQLENHTRAYFDVALKLSEGMVNGNLDPGEIPQLVQSMNDKLSVTKDELNRFNEAALKAFNDTVEASNAATQDALVVSLGLSVGAILIIILISASSVILITRNLNLMLESLKDIASGEGDLTKRIEQTSQDEIGDLVYWFNLFM